MIKFNQPGDITKKKRKLLMLKKYQWHEFIQYLLSSSTIIFQIYYSMIHLISIKVGYKSLVPWSSD